MGVKDKLIDGRLVSVIREIDQTSRELKAAQIRGSGSIINYRIFSASEYDILVPGDYSTGNIYEIEFIPDNMQFGGALCYRLFAEWVGVGTYPIGTRSVYQWGLRRQFVGADGKQKWRFTNQNGSLEGAKFKLYFFAQGSGTFTVKKL